MTEPQGTTAPGDGGAAGGLAGAVAFLTVIGRGRQPDRTSLMWFGPVGLLVGATCGLVRWGGGEWWSTLLAAGLAVVADLVLTGALHLDGLADSADGLLPHMARERRLAVMAEPDVGAFAVVTIVAVLIVRWSALASAEVEGWHWVALLAGIWCGARALMATVVTTVPYARPGGGLATAFRGGRVAAPAALGGLLALAGVAAGSGGAGVVALAVGLAAGAGVVALAQRRLGGFTGDVARRRGRRGRDGRARRGRRAVVTHRRPGGHGRRGPVRWRPGWPWSASSPSRRTGTTRSRGSAAPCSTWRTGSTETGARAACSTRCTGAGLGAASGAALRRLLGPDVSTAIATNVTVGGRMLTDVATDIGTSLARGDLEAARRQPAGAGRAGPVRAQRERDRTGRRRVRGREHRRRGGRARRSGPSWAGASARPPTGP